MLHNKKGHCTSRNESIVVRYSLQLRVPTPTNQIVMFMYTGCIGVLPCDVVWSLYDLLTPSAQFPTQVRQPGPHLESQCARKRQTAVARRRYSVPHAGALPRKQVILLKAFGFRNSSRCHILIWLSYNAAKENF